MRNDEASSKNLNKFSKIVIFRQNGKFLSKKVNYYMLAFNDCIYYLECEYETNSGLAVQELSYGLYAASQILMF